MSEPLTRTAASEAVADIGWRYLLGTLCAYVPVSSYDDAVAVGSLVVAEAGDDGEQHLRFDVRPRRVELALQDRDVANVTPVDVALAGRITAALAEHGLSTLASPDAESSRSVQTIEFAIDALDIAMIRPFWKAVLAYEDEPGHSGPEDPLVDPLRQGPAMWFQQMDEPRPQRNRIHFDITVPHDAAEARMRAALDAGGVLVSDAHARSFWILADAEGNEICICTWQDRDPST
ncbi:MAG: 4a-hydroxytetrahydrobiopterin dehydratase [Pseudonocardiales bacterium]|nr:4a-hydroxytetrahydrobiopterin dehydratase [Pseudonocardiales bacterium]